MHFAQWKPDFNEFIDKFLKFEEVQYQIRYIKSNLKVWNVISLILCKFPISFSTAKHKLGHNFSKFVHGFKLGFFIVSLWLKLVLSCTSSFSQFTKKLNMVNLEYCFSLDFPVFPKSWKRWKIGIFKFWPIGCTCKLFIIQARDVKLGFCAFLYLFLCIWEGWISYYSEVNKWNFFVIGHIM